MWLLWSLPSAFSGFHLVLTCDWENWGSFFWVLSLLNKNNLGADLEKISRPGNLSVGLDSCQEEGGGKKEEGKPHPWSGERKQESYSLLSSSERQAGCWLCKQLSLMCIVTIGTQARTGPSTPGRDKRMQAQCLPSLLTMLKANLGNL